MRAVLVALVVLLSGCARPTPPNPGGLPEGCDPSTDSHFLLGEAGPSTITPGSNSSLLVDVVNCSGSAPLVLDRVPGGAGNCVFDFVVVDLVQGERTWDVQRGVNGSALAPPPFALPCPAYSDQNVTVPPNGSYDATFGWNATLRATNGTIEPAPPGTYEIVARARLDGHDMRASTNVTVVEPGLRVEGADFQQVLASPLDVATARAALSAMGFTVEPPVGADVGRMRDGCVDMLRCTLITYAQRAWNGSPALNVSLPSGDPTNYGEDAAAAQRAGDALCRELASNATALVSEFDARAKATPAGTLACSPRIAQEP